MKKLSIALVAVLWAGSAFAGSYHRGTSLVCSDCHTMHASRQHKFGLTGEKGTDDFMTTVPWYANGGTGNGYLLVGDSTTDTCLACHDGNANIPDVMGANAGANQRPAGRLNDVADSTAIQQTGHTMDIASAPPPGWSAWRTGQNSDVWTNSARSGYDADFTCADCHSVHGGPAYRNLGNSRGRVGINLGFSGQTWGLAPTYRYDATAPAAGSMLIPSVYNVDVVMSAGPKAGAAINAGDNYNSAQIAYTVANGDTTVTKYVSSFNTITGTNLYYSGIFAQDQNGSAAGKDKMNGYCATCHGNFHGDANVTHATEKFKKHPTSGKTNGLSTLITSNPAKTPVKIVWADASNYEPGCLSCHKAHGTTNPFGLIFPADKSQGGTAFSNLDTDLENGDGSVNANASVRLLCITCHSMGRTGGADLP